MSYYRIKMINPCSFNITLNRKANHRREKPHLRGTFKLVLIKAAIKGHFYNLTLLQVMGIPPWKKTGCDKKSQIAQ